MPWREEKVILAALAGLERVGAERRKLLGLDAPSQLVVDITNHDAITDELNEMLARAGRKPIIASHPPAI